MLAFSADGFEKVPASPSSKLAGSASNLPDHGWLEPTFPLVKLSGQMLAGLWTAFHPARPVLRIGLAGLALWGLPLAADAAVLWEHLQPIQVQNRSEEILHGALVPRDDSSSETLYFKFRARPLSDVLTKAQAHRPYMAGLVFCQGSTENLGIGDAWDAWGYSAFCKSFKVRGNMSGELTLHTDTPESGAQMPYLAPRRDVPKVFVVKVEYVPRAQDRVTVWLAPNLNPGATEGSQSDRIVTRFTADASFDQIRLMHRGEGDGWVFDDLAMATSFEDFVRTPLWKRAWFLAVLSAALVSVVLIGVVLAERRRAGRLMAVIEREQAVAAERVRIAQDLHDDLGAKLTEIVLLGELAAKPTGAADEQNPLREMLQGLRELHASLDEAVWSINPRHDSLAQLVEFMSESAQRFLRCAPLTFHPEVAEDLPQTHLSASQRHNLLMAVKEALNNAVRHAGATSIRLRVDRFDGGVRISVQDDGCGIEESRLQAGDGLRNMRERLGRTGGKVEIRSQPGAGTEVVFELPLSS